LRKVRDHTNLCWIELVLAEYIKVSSDTCIQIVSKVGSISMRSALAQVPHIEITAIEALSLDKRVMFVRNPLVRLASAFHHFWWLELNNSSYNEFLPKGIILADGGRIEGRLGLNEHRHSGERKLFYDTKISDEISKGGTINEISKRLRQEDWNRFVDYVLSKSNNDEHWIPQLDVAKHSGVIVANIAHRFEDVSEHWAKYVGATLPEKNSWQGVPKVDYRLDELKSYYAETLDFWRAIDGTWNAS